MAACPKALRRRQRRRRRRESRVREMVAATPEERARRMQLISDRLNMRKDEIAAIIASEVGMPLPLATAVQPECGGVMASYAKMLCDSNLKEQIGNAVVIKDLWEWSLHHAVELPAASGGLQSAPRWPQAARSY